MAKAKLPHFKCPKCSQRFSKKFIRDSHLSSEHDIHVTFRSLVHPGWGQKKETLREANEFRKSPSDDALLLGYLEVMLEELRNIKSELCRVRTIT